MEKGEKSVALFTIIYLLIASLFALMSGNWEFVFYIVIMLLLIAFVMTVHLKVQFTIGTLWALSVWGLLHMIGGLLPIPDGLPYAGTQVFYSLWIIPNYLKYDQITHAYGFGIATYGAWQAICSTTGVSRPTMGLVIISALVGMGLGAFNEVVEFAAVLAVPETNVGGYINTGWDLVFNMLGAVIAAVYIKKYWRAT